MKLAMVFRTAILGMVVSVVALAIPGCSAEGVQPGDVAYTGDAISDFVAAIQAGDVATVERLAGSDPSLLGLQDGEGQSAIHYAALSNQPGVIRVLHEKGLDVNVRDFEGRTPLTVLEDSGFRFEEARDMLIKLGGEN